MDNHSLRSPERRTPSRPSKRSSMSEEWERNEQALSDHTLSLLMGCLNHRLHQPLM